MTVTIPIDLECTHSTTTTPPTSLAAAFCNLTFGYVNVSVCRRSPLWVSWGEEEERQGTIARLSYAEPRLNSL